MSVVSSFNAYDTHSVLSVSGSTSLVAVTLPDLVLIVAAAATTILLPKIGTAFAPVGTRVTLRKNDPAGAGAVTVTAFTGDTIDGGASGGSLNGLALPASARNSVTIQAISATAWITVDSSVVGI